MKRRINLIPMAGEGKRFQEAGYSVPKPLIPVGGVPMVVRAVDSLPQADHHIFVCRRAHLENSDLKEALRSRFSPCDFVELDRLTEGQAATCLTARKLLRDDDELTIGACDNAMIWDAAHYARTLATSDALIWTFRGNPAVLQNPHMYGWVDCDASLKVRSVSCKVPISAEPLRDHAVIGAFTWRRAADFLSAADRTIAENRRINGEFYMDVVFDTAVRQGRVGRAMEVSSYIGFGTPADLDLYHYWRHYFSKEFSTTPGD